MLGKSTFPILGWIMTILMGCTHHSVRVTPTDNPDNRLIIREEVRSWPVTLVNYIAIKIPNGKYTYVIGDYGNQTNYPEKPVRTVQFPEIEVIIKDAISKDFNGGWIAIYRDGVDIELIWGNQPATFNGKYTTAVPFVEQAP
jgi:hypothetical protein